MAKYRVQLRQKMLVETEVEFYVQFDTETGDAEVTTGGTVVDCPKIVNRRTVARSEEGDDLDLEAFAALIASGELELPQIAAVVTLSTRQYIFDPEDGVFPTDPHNVTADDLEAALEPMTAPDPAPVRIRVRRRRRRFRPRSR